MNSEMLPEAFLQQMKALLGEDRLASYLSAFAEEPPVSIRVNPLKLISNEQLVMSNYDYIQSQRDFLNAGTNHNYSLLITHYSLGKEMVPWCPLGFYLPTRPNFTFDPLLHAGCYYVQEAASMFIHHIISNELSLHSSISKVLDLCAAPGGKSTCALGALPPETELWSNEPVRNRASILSENMQKWGYPNCHVTNNYPRDYACSGMQFDVILCDVPCSGEGMFRKDPRTIGEWSPQNVEKCWRLQREIVADAWQCLRPGGMVIYSTCTYNIKENEENVRWMIDEFDAELVAIPVLSEWNITGSLLPGFQGPVYRFIPGITRSEGLFVAVLRKKGGAYSGSKSKKKAGADKLFQLNALLMNADPSLPTADLDYATAIGYLRGESIVLPADTPRGLVTVMFQGHALGQVKNIGTRANNLYPKEWRIKSTHVPGSYEKIV